MPSDSERLDWLTRQKYGCWGVNTTIDMRQGMWVYQVETSGEAYQGRTLRDAIDEAIKHGDK